MTQPKAAPTPPKIAVLLGSVRAASNTAKVVQIVSAELRAKGAQVDVIDPRELTLLFPGLAGQEEACAALEAGLRARVAACAGVVLVTPEYDGSYSAIMKLLLEYLGYPSTLAGKVVTVIGLASGRIGASRAVEHLRAVCLHIGALVLPHSPSLANVHRLFGADGACTDADAERQLRGAAERLLNFLGAWRR